MFEKGQDWFYRFSKHRKRKYRTFGLEIVFYFFVILFTQQILGEWYRLSSSFYFITANISSKLSKVLPRKYTSSVFRNNALHMITKPLHRRHRACCIVPKIYKSVLLNPFAGNLPEQRIIIGEAILSGFLGTANKATTKLIKKASTYFFSSPNFFSKVTEIRNEGKKSEW